MGKYISPQTWGKLTCYCATCGKEIPPHTVCFEAWADGAGNTCCSMACARKALGIEPETEAVASQYCRMAGCPAASCANCDPCHMVKPACANYEPEAEPFDFPACPCVFIEPEAVPEAEVWSFGVNLSTRNTSNGYIRGLHATMPNGKQRVVLVHDAGFDIDGNDIALLQAAPQTARKLKAAEATINDRDAEIRLLNGVCDRVVKAEAEADTLRDVLKTVREELRAMRHNVDCAIIANRNAIRVIDAALGKDGA